MNELALFAGAGGGILGGKLLGWRTVCAVEREPYAASVLAQRQNDGILPAFPIWDDVCTFDGKPWRGIVDVVSGGFPCQDISVAGKGAGIEGERSGLWGEMARIIGEVRPGFVFVENSPAIVIRGLGRVLGDLAALGYDCRWTVLGAADVGAPHQRHRFWLVGSDTMRNRCEADNRREPLCNRNGDGSTHAAGRQEQQPRTGGQCCDVADTGREHGQRREGEQDATHRKASERHEATDYAQRCCEVASISDAACAGCAQQEWAGQALLGARSGEFARPHGGRWDHWLTEPDVGRVADGVAARVDRLKAIGNGQVPHCAAEAWRILTHNVVNHRTQASEACRRSGALEC